MRLGSRVSALESAAGADKQRAYVVVWDREDRAEALAKRNRDRASAGLEQLTLDDVTFVRYRVRRSRAEYR